DAMTSTEADPRSLTVIAIVGSPGVGKTALAVRWAHQAADRFPDGQLFVDLRGHDPDHPPVRPVEALTYVLRALAVAPGDIPVDADEAAALFRSVVTGRRILMVLDNAASAQQVRLLLPPSPDCVVVVTSRNALTGLVARQGARSLRLGTLNANDASILLA